MSDDEMLDEQAEQDIVGILDALANVENLSHLNVSRNLGWEGLESITNALQVLRKKNKI